MENYPDKQTVNTDLNEKVSETIRNLHTLIENGTPKNDTLLGGRLGLAIYYFTRWQYYGQHEDAEKAQDLLEQVYQHLENDRILLYSNAFAGGAAGLAWTAFLFYQYDLVDMDPAEDLADLDQFLFTTALEQIENQDRIDYLHGATGTLHYFTRRLPDKKTEGYMTTLITALYNKAIKEERGWWFHNWVIDEKEKEQINLSLSHGLCGYLLILCHAWQAGLHLPMIKEIIERGIDFLFSYQQTVDIEKNQWSFFPSTIRRQETEECYTSSRLAWCYGDFGPVLVLQKAGMIFQNPDWLQCASVFGTFSLMRKTPENTASTESLICHGSAGMAACYKSLEALSGIDRYREGYRYWIEQTLALLPSELEKGTYDGKETEFLEGLVGVNLALMGYVQPEKPEWPAILLL